MKDPILFIVSAVSGAGKTTLIHHLLSVFPQLVFSVSATTRAPRPGEIDGKDYIFLDKAAFEAKIQENAFLEYASVYQSHNYYGTLKDSICGPISNGKSVVCDVNVQGFYQIEKNYPGKIVSVFIQLPSLEVMKQRLVYRNTNTPQQIEERLKTAQEESKHISSYDHVIVNDDLEVAKKDIVALFYRYLC